MRIITLIVLVSASLVAADVRPFTFTYETYPMGKGNYEYEQWLTYRTHAHHDPGAWNLDVRHEFEIGVTDNFDLSIYVASWRYEESEDQTGTEFSSTSIEGIWYLLNPVTDSFGLALYGEAGVGDREAEFEAKLLLQKDLGDWTIAYNLIIETEVEGIFSARDKDEVEGVIGHSFGISHPLSRNWTAGGELLIESIYDDWKRYKDTVVYAGPVISFIGGHNWWVTVTPMFQLSDVDDEADYLVRMIAGVEF